MNDLEHQKISNASDVVTNLTNVKSSEGDKNDAAESNSDWITDKTKDDTELHERQNSLQSDTTQYKNAKERFYDKIPISLKTLDLIIGLLITVLVLMMAYFIIRKIF